jgi:hypothetical protein
LTCVTLPLSGGRKEVTTVVYWEITKNDISKFVETPLLAVWVHNTAPTLSAHTGLALSWLHYEAWSRIKVMVDPQV